MKTNPKNKIKKMILIYFIIKIMSKMRFKRTVRKYLKKIKYYQLQFKMLQKLIRQTEITNLNYDEIYYS